MSSGIVQKIVGILDQVYGAYGPGWVPQFYAENKSRYLWTDAFGVINYLTLFCETKEQRFLEQAKSLVQHVHDTLGKARDGSKRLGEATNERPLAGGLRIGKPQGEGPSMSQDGQYYHYLIKWMFALNRMSKVTKDPIYNNWAIDLVQAVHPKFTYGPASGRRMYWKMSIDLSRALVSSEGQGDPFSGYVVYKLVDQNSGVLKDEIAELQQMVEKRYPSYGSDDCLGIGCTLWLSAWFPEEPWSKHMFKVCKSSAEHWWKSEERRSSARHRLAFREFGLTIGVQLVPELMERWGPRVAELHDFWKPPRLFERDSDITPVMYCTSLFPGVFSANYQF